MNLLDGSDQTIDDRDEILNKWKDKSQEDLLKKAVEADLHIRNLEREAAERHQMYTNLYEESKTKASLTELIDQIKNEKSQVALTPANEEVKMPELDLTKLEDIFDKKLTAYERQKKETENFGKVLSKLRDSFGENYGNTLKDRYNQLGLSNEDMNDLAKKSPEAYFRMMGLNDQPRETYQGAPRSSQRNDSFSPKGAPKRDYWYYQEMKKNNPKLYLDPKISAQMERDYAELGDAFGLPD
jgi:hypothetical protein